MAPVIEQAMTVAAQTLLLVVLGPAVVGYVRWLKARMQGRRGAGMLQPYREVRKLFAKQMVIPKTASWVFHLAPFALCSTTVTATMLVPVIVTGPSADGLGDLFVLAALLMSGTVFLALGGLDPGTAFGGMGSSREMTIAALTEPTIAISVLALALTTGSTSLGAITDGLVRAPVRALGPGHVLAFAAFFIATLAEAGRLPVDNPSTHLELTMVHEAMVLEYSGPYLALIEWTAAIRLTLLLTLAVNLFFPWGLATTLGAGPLALAALLFATKILLIGAALAVLETRVAKLRLFRVPELLAVSFTLALLAAASAVFVR